ncbi:hypothetical protein V1318_04340 [Lysobacter sp. CCNWLW3]|uniref:hypothetical protein n=1 Tax=unclassified Lysobacter TaxID=2635362 RepID=UPI002FD142A5
MGEGILWLIGTVIYRMTCGWSVVIRVDFCDPTVGRPHGLFYGAILNDENGQRILGLDNSHAFDNAQPDDPFDHEHLPGKVGQRFPYVFKNPNQLVSDIFDRVEAHCHNTGTPFEFEGDGDE